jgi:shikimate dehydrogenase
MSEGEIRAGTLGDFGVVAALNREVQDLHARNRPDLFKDSSAETLTQDVFVRWLADSHVFVAVADNQVVGYLQAEIIERAETPYRFEQRIFYIHQIVVASSARHQGHAHRLIRAAKAGAQELGLAFIELETWSFNLRAQAFFGNEGFHPIKARLSSSTALDDVD